MIEISKNHIDTTYLKLLKIIYRRMESFIRSTLSKLSIQMKVTRRSFLKTGLVYAAILSMSKIAKANETLVLAANQVKRMLKTGQGLIHIVWIQGQTCSGDSVALLNSVDPSIVDVLIGQVKGVPEVSLDYHATLMPQWGVDHLEGPEGPTAVEWDANRIVERAYDGALDPFVLVVEGSVPTEDEAKAAGGFYCSIGERDEKIYYMEDWVKKLASKAAAVVAIGTCATYGGIPSGTPNPTKSRGVYDVLGHDWKSALGLPVINVPGCPAGGDWQVKTIGHLLLTVQGLLPPPEVDEYHRPIFLYGETVHETCSRGVYFSLGEYSKNYGEQFCMFALGCKGPIVKCPMNKSAYVEGIGMCTEYGSPCIGCTMPGFPDEPYAPFLTELPELALPKETPTPVQLPSPKAPAVAGAIAGAIAGGAVTYYLTSKPKTPQKASEEGKSEKEEGE